MARQYTEQQQRFLDVLPQVGGNIRLAMTEAGYSKDTRTSDVVRPLKNEIIEIAKELLAFGSVKAVMTLDSVLDSPATLGAKNSIAAAKEILDRAGVIKEETQQAGNPVKVTFYLPEKIKINGDEEEVE